MRKVRRLFTVYKCLTTPAVSLCLLLRKAIKRDNFPAKCLTRFKSEAMDRNSFKLYSNEISNSYRLCNHLIPFAFLSFNF